jgi:transcriptional regulator with XRE-family HTH domain
MGFRENLKSELTYRGMLVKELSALSGISRHTLDNYLNVRENVPTAVNAVKIARVLNVSVEYLVTGQENPQNKSSMSSEIDAFVQIVKHLDESDRKMLYGIAQLFKDK